MSQSLAELRQLILRELVDGFPGCHEPTKVNLCYKLGDDIIGNLANRFRILDNIIASRIVELPEELQKGNTSYYAFSYEGDNDLEIQLRIWAYPEVASICGWSIDNEYRGVCNVLTDEILEKLFNG